MCASGILALRIKRMGLLSRQLQCIQGEESGFSRLLTIRGEFEEWDVHQMNTRDPQETPTLNVHNFEEEI